MEALKDDNLVYIKEKLDDYIERFDEENRYRHIDFYNDIPSSQLKEFFSILHFHINRLFNYMNRRLNSKTYTAAESRDLIYIMEEIKTVQSKLKDTQYEFEFDSYYKDIMNQCDLFLQSGNSKIPYDFERIDIIKDKPLFKVNSYIPVKRNEINVSYTLEKIGSGSYAAVHKYNDEFYNRTFALKRAFEDLDAKEYERFKIEFEEMEKLNSPYVIEVYNFDEENRQYIMEYADETLYDHINDNNLSNSERINFVKQILRAFIYINSKKILHRDVSTTNILIKKYEELKVIKVSDFGLVKREKSSLTSNDSELKGSFNDPKLAFIGFKNYNISHETYALTKLIYFVMTGRLTLGSFENDEFKEFIDTGIADDDTKRYQSVEEMQKAFNKITHTFR
ncbi:protein kinase [Priestia megaterium]